MLIKWQNDREINVEKQTNLFYNCIDASINLFRLKSSMVLHINKLLQF